MSKGVNSGDYVLLIGAKYLAIIVYLYGYHTGLKRKTAKESWMSTELATVLFKMDKEADERWEERERRHLMIEKEEERKRLQLEAELEEKRREQERRHELQMQSMMLSFFQQLHYGSNPTSHNPSLYGSSTRPVPYYPEYNYMPPSSGHNSDDDQ